MNHKIKILRNRTGFDTAGDFQYMSSLFSANGITLVFDVEDTDIRGYRSTPFKNVEKNYQNILEGAIPLCDKYVSPSHAQCLLLVSGVQEFGNDAPSGSMQGFMKNGKTVFTSVEMDAFLDHAGLCRVEMCHETVHAIIRLANSLGYAVEDPMDYMLVNGKQEFYYKNFDPYASDGNFAQAFRNLRQFIDDNTLLQIGMSGRAVQDAQTLLGIKPDGLFGNKTKASVQAFQLENKLIADGIIGRNTWKNLRAKKKAK